MNSAKLRRDLRSQGSNRYEAEQLLVVAQSLGKLPVPHLDGEAKEAIAQQLGIRHQHSHIYNRLAFAGGIVAVVLVMATAWFSGPGSHIYGVKGLTNFFHNKAQPSVGQKLTAPSLSPEQPLQPLPDSQKAKSTSSSSSSASTSGQSSNTTTNGNGQHGHSSGPTSGHGTGWYNSNQQAQNQSTNWFNTYLLPPNNFNN